MRPLQWVLLSGRWLRFCTEVHILVGILLLAPSKHGLYLMSIIRFAIYLLVPVPKGGLVEFFPFLLAWWAT